jgi:predicted metal-dependent HD superfamily phosphohydrolase
MYSKVPATAVCEISDGSPRVPQDILGEMVQAYSAPERYYHNLAHIRA